MQFAALAVPPSPPITSLTATIEFGRKFVYAKPAD